jgi:uncharacterized protein (UPF0332 family)
MSSDYSTSGSNSYLLIENKTFLILKGTFSKKHTTCISYLKSWNSLFYSVLIENKTFLILKGTFSKKHTTCISYLKSWNSLFYSVLQIIAVLLSWFSCLCYLFTCFVLYRKLAEKWYKSACNYRYKTEHSHTMF